MKPYRVFALVALGLALATSAGAQAQEGTWEIAGEVRFVYRYEGQRIRGSLPFAVVATLAADGHYEVLTPACAPGVAPPVLTGTWSRGSDRFLRAIVRDGIRTNITSCGGSGVRLGNLRVRQRLAADGQGLTGEFVASLRYRFVDGDELEIVRARLHGVYAGTRVAAP